jgi:hypothetical protein
VQSTGARSSPHAKAKTLTGVESESYTVQNVSDELVIRSVT